MKYVPFVDGDGFKAREVFLIVLRDPGERGADYEEIVRRGKVMAALRDLAADAIGVQLEDADWEVLKRAAMGYRFRLVDPALQQMLEALRDAKAPPAAMLPKLGSAETLPPAQPNGGGEHATH